MESYTRFFLQKTNEWRAGFVGEKKGFAKIQP